MQAKTSTRRRESRDMRHITKLGDGRFMAKIPDGRGPNGELLYKRFKAEDVDVVIARRDEYLKARTEDNAPRTIGKLHKMTVGEWLDHWLAAIVRLESSATTFDHYSSVVANLIAPKSKVWSLRPVPLAELTVTRLEKWRDDLVEDGIGSSSVNTAIARLRTALEVAFVRQAETGLKSNPAKHVAKLKIAAEDNYLGDPADTAKLYLAAGGAGEGAFMAALPIVATDLGLRRSEIMGLHWSDLALDADVPTVTLNWHVITSGKSTRIVPGTKTSEGKAATLRLSERSVQVLKRARAQLLEHKLQSGAWKAGQVSRAVYVTLANAREGRPYIVPTNPLDGLVFPRKDGDVIADSTLADWLYQVCDKAGIARRGLHQFRHDCGSFLLAAGVPLPVVSKHMRHASPDITAKVYAHMLKSQESLAAETQSRMWDRIFGEATAIAV